MNTILFQLKKPDATQQDEQRRWQSAAFDISQLDTKGGEVFCSHGGALLLRSGSAIPLLGRAIQIAVERRLAYTMTFFEKATEWQYQPQDAG